MTLRNPLMVCYRVLCATLLSAPRTASPQPELHGRGEGRVRYHGDGTKQVTETLVTPDGSKMGVWRDSKTGRQAETDRFTVHYSRAGTHVVPSRPIRGGSDGPDN